MQPRKLNEATFRRSVFAMPPTPATRLSRSCTNCPALREGTELQLELVSSRAAAIYTPTDRSNL